MIRLGSNQDDQRVSASCPQMSRRRFLLISGLTCAGVLGFISCSKNPKAPEEQKTDKDPNTDHFREQ